MNKILKSGLALFAGVATFASCSDFEPTGYGEVPNLPTASAVKAEVSGHTVNVSWQVPSSKDITGIQFVKNADTRNPVMLEPTATSYAVKGQPLGVEGLFTVKICYSINGMDYVSEGVTATATLPDETLPGVSNLKQETAGRTVTLSWTLPSSNEITGVRIYRDGNVDAAVILPADATSYQMKSQPMGMELNYTVDVIYDTFYASMPASVSATVPYITPKMAYLLTAASVDALPDDDEQAAAKWFAAQQNSEFVTIDKVAELEPDLYPVLWIEIDRKHIGSGWQSLPAEVSGEPSIAALRQYISNGGNLYLSNMATQLTVPLGFVPDNMAPGIFGDGDGGSGDDVWVINPHLGWDFRDGADQGYYDRAGHAIYAGLTLDDPNGYGYSTLPLIGPGQREDHNCMWDCNLYGRGSQPDVIRNFEITTNSLVLATWGHVRDHCVAGLVEFYSNTEHGRCIANGLAAYEWNQNSGTNPYQNNIEQLTLNILNYLK